MALVRVAVRLRFVKLPGVTGVRVFRDVMDVIDPETRSFEDLSRMVEKKLSFMQLPSYDFIIFYVDDGGERVVVDDAYFNELLTLWVKSAVQLNNNNHNNNSSSISSSSSSSSIKRKKEHLWESNVSKNKTTTCGSHEKNKRVNRSPVIAILGCSSLEENELRNIEKTSETDDSSEGNSSDDDSCTSSNKESITVHCTFEIEVNSINTFGASTFSSSSNHASGSTVSTPPIASQNINNKSENRRNEENELGEIVKENMCSNSFITNNNNNHGDNSNDASINNLKRQEMEINKSLEMNKNTMNTSLKNTSVNGHSSNGEVSVQRLPLTAQNLNIVISQQQQQQQQHEQSEQKEKMLRKELVTPANNKDNNNNSITTLMNNSMSEGATLHKSKCLICVNELTQLLLPHMSMSPPLSSYFVRCIIMAIRFKEPKPTISVTEMELCDALYSTTQQITAITFDSVVQRAIRERLRGDGRQVIELNHFMLRRKTDVDIKYQYNTHPLQIRLDRTCKMEIVQIRNTSILSELHLSSSTPSPLNEVITTREEINSGNVLHFSDLIGISQRKNSNINNSNSSNNVVGNTSHNKVNENFTAPLTVHTLNTVLSSSSSSSSAGGHALSSRAVNANSGPSFVDVSSSTSNVSAAFVSSHGSYNNNSFVAPTNHSPPPLTGRRTTFSFCSGNSNNGSNNNSNSSSNSTMGGNVGCTSASVSGVVPSLLGRRIQEQQVNFITTVANRENVNLNQIKNMIGITQQSNKIYRTNVNTSPSCTQEIQQREKLLSQHMSREEERKERIRRKGKVNQCCILCGLNCEDEVHCMELVQSLLTANRQNRGTHIPTLAELRYALSDRRVNSMTGNSNTNRKEDRLVCKTHFVNLEHKTLHVVHPRCAHLCTAYQRGSEIEDFVLCELNMQICTLCGLPGATVCCYHPDCDERYHIVCAIFSNGYVNFGEKDPYLPCVACPKHTLVKLRKRPRDEPIASRRSSKEISNGNRTSSTSNDNTIRSGILTNEENVLHIDQSCWHDGIAFDSRVVESTDLRDPDENDGV